MPYPLLLHAKHRETPVTYEPFGEWLVPWRFDAGAAEYQALRTGVGLLDYSTQAWIEVQGADRVGFLHHLLSHDIKRLVPGGGCQAALLTAGAKFTAELLVLADAEVLWLVCDVNRASAVTETLQRYQFSEAVTLANYERRYATLALQGPRTLEVLSTLVEALDTLRNPGDHVLRPFHDVPLRIIRHSLAGDAGVLCVCPAEHASLVWQRLREEGAQTGLTLVGWEALNTARIEAGIPWYGLDMDESALLPETGLETRLASETKGCYLGQEIVARMQTYGSANKKLMGLLFDGKEVPERGDTLMRDGKEAGRVTSACFSPALNQAIGMGYVKRGCYEPGTMLELPRWGMRMPVTVAERPVVPYSC